MEMASFRHPRQSNVTHSYRDTVPGKACLIGIAIIWLFPVTTQRWLWKECVRVSPLSWKPHFTFPMVASKMFLKCVQIHLKLFLWLFFSIFFHLKVWPGIPHQVEMKYNCTVCPIQKNVKAPVQRSTEWNSVAVWNDARRIQSRVNLRGSIFGELCILAM